MTFRSFWLILVIFLSALFWLKMAPKQESQNFQLEIMPVSSSTAYFNKTATKWEMDQYGYLFERENPIWIDQVHQIFLDEKKLNPNFRLFLSLHPLCPSSPLLDLLSLCAEHQISISLCRQVHPQPNEALNEK